MAKSEDIDPETKARIAAHLRRKRKELGLSKRKLALLIGVSPPALVKILNATRNVGTAVLLKIHRRLHIDLNQLVGVDPAREFFQSGDDERELDGVGMVAEPQPAYGSKAARTAALGAAVIGAASEGSRNAAVQIASAVGELDATEAEEVARKTLAEIRKIRQARGAKTKRSG